MKLAVPLLAAAAFAMLTNEFNIIGIIPLIARDLDVPIPKVGLLVTAFAFTVAIAGPFLTLRLQGLERRLLFTGVLAVTAVGAAVAAFAPSYAVLAAGRIVSALALPVFWSMATSTAARIAGPDHAGRAIATVFSGVSIASVVGSPIATILADAFGWRVAFGTGAAICALVAVLIWTLFPRMTVEAEAHPVSPVKVLAHPIILVNLLMSFFALTAMFTSYTYLADTLTRLGNFTDGAAGWILMGFGVAGIVGNEVAGRFVDGSPIRAAIASIAVAGAAMAMFPSALGSVAATTLTLAIWGAAHAAGFVTNHVRAMCSAPAALQDLTASLNVSVFNAGIGMGAVVGGKVIDAAGLSDVGPAGAIVGALALSVAAVIVIVARRQSRISVKAAIAARPTL